MKNTKLILFYVTQQRYELRYAAEAVSEPSEKLDSISANGGDITAVFANTAKKAQRLAVYSFQTTKNPRNKGSWTFSITQILWRTVRREQTFGLLSLQKPLERYLMQQSFNVQPQALDMETTTADSRGAQEVAHEDICFLGTMQYQTTLGIEQINFNI